MTERNHVARKIRAINRATRADVSRADSLQNTRLLKKTGKIESDLLREQLGGDAAHETR